ncbi:hypothetical protein IMZ48_02870 [Candidatus Bathyarchaeota archaeon]|nr:hypothetical protein [Candidatus Bathyarchaeota archaeon]
MPRHQLTFWVRVRFGDLAIGAHNEGWYKKDLCQHPALRSFVAEMTGWGENTHGLTRTLLRNNMPGNKAVGVHYDQIFLRHGDDRAITAWVPIGKLLTLTSRSSKSSLLTRVPIGDVKIDGGGLMYLEKGHDLGAQIERDFAERAKAAGFSDEEMRHAYNANMMGGGLLTEEPLAFAREHGRRWLLTAYEAGDVIFHNAYAVRISPIHPMLMFLSPPLFGWWLMGYIHADPRLGHKQGQRNPPRYRFALCG